ncbi:uncharacterized protein LOC114940616 [Nylanderia fulva]|uniref:uncharacterized protein LOC114940616 n=1 Tax=Nylanderia fulva TaxID=613905 RepID=UPI0010FB3DE4|nr:uncharacterized protein LOC114940616 [Nylanderia fulva]
MQSVAGYRDARSTLSATLLCILLVAVTDVRGLSNVSIDIPLAVAAGTTVNMSCKYDLQSEALYTVKWYKGSEFFRYVPKEMPPIAVFGDLGTKVLINQSDAHQ